MSRQYALTEQDVIKKCFSVIHSFYERKIQPIADLLDQNFVWIGAYEFQYLAGKEAFLKSIRKESEEPSIQVSQEEYHLLAHSGSLWSIYGRFTVTAVQDDGTFLMAKVRNTFVWREENNHLILMHIHGSHARDVPLEYKEMPSLQHEEREAWFDYLKRVDRLMGPPKRICFKTTDGIYRFLLPAEILYITAENKTCTVYTLNGSFTTRIPLKEAEQMSTLFIRIHRAYLVNIRFVLTSCRYRVTMSDGSELPIGKERYLDVREQLKTQQKENKAPET